MFEPEIYFRKYMKIYDISTFIFVLFFKIQINENLS